MEYLSFSHKLHNIKILKGYYFSILNGTKTFEFRLFDRDYKVGDFIHFKPLLLSGEVQEKYDDYIFEIKYILPLGKNFKNYCVFSIIERKDLCFDFLTKTVKKRDL